MTASHARSQLRQCPVWSHWPGSNRPPARYECAALPDELQWLTGRMLLLHLLNQLVDVVVLMSFINIRTLRRIVGRTDREEIYYTCNQE